MPTNASSAAPADAPDRRVDLIRTAYRLFSEKGVHRVRLAHRAAAAGLSKGLVIYYFKTTRPVSNGPGRKIAAFVMADPPR
jgi:AcrR family transcriptional regulator